MSRKLASAARLLLCSTFLTIISSGTAEGKNGSLNEVRALMRTRLAAVGRIFIKGDGNQAGAGSAVIIDPSGLVVTNFHQLVNEAGLAHPEIRMALPHPADDFGLLDLQKLYRLEMHHFSSAYDLAILKISEPAGPFPFIPLAPQDEVDLLDVVYVLGYPQIGGDTITVSKAIISGKDNPSHWLKLDGRLVHGFSGGAVLNENGDLIGIPTQKKLDIGLVDLQAVQAKEVAFGSLDFVRPAILIRDLLAKPAGSNRIRVSGRVTDETGKPLSGALIALVRGTPDIVTVENLIHYQRTDLDGGFLILASLSYGNYSLRIKSEGHEVLDRTLEIDRSDITGLNIALMKVKP